MTTHALNGLSAATYASIRQLIDDRDTPPGLAADLADWLARHDRAIDLRNALHAEQRATTAAIRDNVAGRPERIVDALRRDAIDLDAIDGNLDELRARHATIADRMQAVDRALAAIDRHVDRAFLDHVEVLMPYIASQRATAKPGGPIRPHAEHAWARIARAVRVVFPYEAVADDPTRPVPQTQRLTLGSDLRHRWAWAAICLGHVDVERRDDQYRYRPIADWEQRHELIASLAPRDEPTVATVLRKGFGAARRRTTA